MCNEITVKEKLLDYKQFVPVNKALKFIWNIRLNKFLSLKILKIVTNMKS